MRAAAAPVAAALAATALFCLGLVVLPDGVSAVADAVLLSLAPGVAAVMARRRSRLDRPDAHSWHGAAIALAFTAVGQVLWFVSEVAGGAADAVLLVSHGAYFAALPAAALSVREVLGPLDRRQRRNHAMEVATVAAAAIGSSWLVAWPTLDGGFATADVVGVLYPIGYLTMAGALLFALAHRRSAELASFAVLAMGLLAAAGANMWFAATGTRPDYVAGHPVDGAWFGAYALVVAATFVAPTPHRCAGARSSHSALLLPYIPLVLAFAVVLIGPHDAMDHPVVVVSAVALLVLVLLRQYATVVENVHLAAELATRQSLTLASGRIGTLELHLPTDEVTFSEEVAAICGREPADMPTTLAGAVDLVHVDDVGRLLEGLATAVESGTAAVEYRVLRPDGEVYWVETRAEVQGNRLVGVVFDITPRKRAEDELVRVARHDTLTGLLARGAITAEIDRVASSSEPAAVFLLDLDGFKDVNDSLGHATGDRVLIEVAARLQASLRDDASISRLGGDEFAVVVPGVGDLEQAGTVATRIIDALLQVLELGGLRLSVRASVGVALAPEHGGDAVTLLRRADAAMYRAKQRGATWRAYAPGDDDVASSRLELIADLRTAIAEGAIEVHYQPKVGGDDAQPRGVEALARWTHPERGPIGPAEFVTLAERAGLELALTDHVLRTALSQLAAWRAGGLDVDMAVNVSPSVLCEPGFPATVASALVATDVPAVALTIEVTENALADDQAALIAALHDLRELGVLLSIDDFGTGYSSLAYLKDLPVSELKLDRGFVSTVAVDDRSLAIVTLTIDMAHRLGLAVVAEGVEDDPTSEVLRGAGCDLLQGYGICRPGPAPLIGEWLVEAGARRAIRTPAELN